VAEQHQDAWQVLPLGKLTLGARQGFDCGVEALNLYFALYARQNDERGLSRAFFVPGPAGSVAAYYCLSAAQVAFVALPLAARRRLPLYPVPAARITRLAVDRRFQGRGRGEFILGDALNRVLGASKQLGIKAILVDAKDTKAAAFYAKYGFWALPQTPGCLFLFLKQ